MAGKRDPQWEGSWSAKAEKIPCNVESTDGQRTKVVHVNCLDIRCSQQQLQLPQWITLDIAHNKAGIHLNSAMFCLHHLARHLCLCSPPGVIRQRERDDHLMVSHKLEVEL